MQDKIYLVLAFMVYVIATTLALTGVVLPALLLLPLGTAFLVAYWVLTDLGKALKND